LKWSMEGIHNMINICLIGATGHYGYVLEALENKEADIRLTGIAPGSEGENTEVLYGKLKKIQTGVVLYEDYRKMLDELRPDIAVVCCYFSDHAKASIEAIKRGIHVFSEKPVATEFYELEMLRKEYEKSDVFFAAMFGLRYAPWFFTAWKTVREGKTGKIRLINAQKSYKLGQRGNNFRKRSTYGGTIPWVGSHAIDWLYWFSGKRFNSVFASHSRLFNNNQNELESSALCHFNMEDEVMASVSIDYYRPFEAPGHGDDRIRVVGTEGVIEVRDNKVFLTNNQKQGVQEFEQTEGGQIFIDFIRQVNGQGSSLISAEDSFYITEACLKARQSADENRVIYW